MHKKASKPLIHSEQIESMIHVIRGRKILLDQDLAFLYGVSTGNFNKAVKRNIERFPEDFAFFLTKNEWDSLMFQIGISKVGRGGRRKLPMAFTEHGVAMAANLLKSEKAIAISVEIVRTFIKLREFLRSRKEFDKELSELRSFILRHSQKSDQEFRKVWQAIEKLGSPVAGSARRLGFDIGAEV